MLNPNFIAPQYGGHCFSDIPATIQALLTGQGSPALAPEHLAGLAQRYDTVILFLIDSFGWRFFEQYAADYAFLKRIQQEGHVSRITAQFPSTTAAHVTCIHTGLPPGQSGVWEWRSYEPQLDAMITPLLYSFSGDKQRDTLAATGIAPEMLYPQQTLYQALGRQKVTSYLFQHRDIADTPYTNVVTKGANIRGYKSLSEALVNLIGLLAEQTTPTYIYLYFDMVDSLLHSYGPDAPQVEAEIDTLLTMLDRLFLQKVAGKQGRDTLFMMVADHGQAEINPDTSIYLNLDPRFKGFERYLKRDAKGALLTPGGSCRDVFLYIKEDLLDEAQLFFAERLAGKAEVYAVQSLIEAGYFGPTPVSATFAERVGNLVILPYRYEAVWWYEKGRFDQTHYGGHGGLTPQEMEIPLLLLSL